MYNSASGKISCGKLSESGSGYVIEMAIAHDHVPTCPQGYNYIGNLDQGSLSARGITGAPTLQYFACAKG
jgi:hypothetical protein